MLTITDITFKYAGARNDALRSISAEIAEGSFVTLCGISGCGKSTLLRLLKPEIAPAGTLSGAVSFCGGKLSELSPLEAAKSIAFVAQNPDAQIVTDKVWHELAFGLESTGVSSADMRRLVAECAEYFGLERMLYRSTDELSGGEKQLVTLASAAALHPKLLLLDEPTSQLDPIAAQSLIDAVKRLNRDFGVTVLIAEHRLEELLPISDKVIVMDAGAITADCSPRELAAALPDSHPMSKALPAAMRVYRMAAGAESPNPPLTVREGRANALCREYLAANAPRPRQGFAPTGKPLLTARELWISYDGRTDALRSASLKLYRGEVLALLGGNGSGKSTLLMALAGVIKSLGGKVTREKGAKIAFLPQNPCKILQTDSVEEELASRGLDKPSMLAELESAGLLRGMDDTERTEFLQRCTLDLSGGEQQRLALVALLSQSPDVLLLDEPTKGMDAAAKAEFSALLRGLAEGGTAVIAATHDTAFAADCADVCALLSGGEIACELPPEDFFSRNYFYTTPMARLSRGIAEGWV